MSIFRPHSCHRPLLMVAAAISDNASNLWLSFLALFLEPVHTTQLKNAFAGLMLLMTTPPSVSRRLALTSFTSCLRRWTTKHILGLGRRAAHNISASF